MDNGQLTTEEREAATPDWKEKVKAAHDMVHALCQPRGSEGSRRWVMSIPAREDYDPDLVITSGLMAAEKYIDTLTAERDELQRRLDAVIPEVYVALLDRCYCEEVDDEDFDEQEQCEYCLRIAKLRAIAEGRTGVEENAGR